MGNQGDLTIMKKLFLILVLAFISAGCQESDLKDSNPAGSGFTETQQTEKQSESKETTAEQTEASPPDSRGGKLAETENYWFVVENEWDYEIDDDGHMILNFESLEYVEHSAIAMKIFTLPRDEYFEKYEIPPGANHDKAFEILKKKFISDFHPEMQFEICELNGSPALKGIFKTNPQSDDYHTCYILIDDANVYIMDYFTIADERESMSKGSDRMAQTFTLKH